MKQLTPVRIPSLSERRVIGIAAGSVHSAAITVRGVLFTWGELGPWLGRGIDDQVSAVPAADPVPAVVDALYGLPCRQVAAGDGCMGVVLWNGVHS